MALNTRFPAASRTGEPRENYWKIDEEWHEGEFVARNAFADYLRLKSSQRPIRVILSTSSKVVWRVRPFNGVD